MNWKRGLTQLYAALWVLFALTGVASVLRLSSSSSQDGSSLVMYWLWWAVIYLALPAVLYLLIRWIAAAFAHEAERIPARGSSAPSSHLAEPPAEEPTPSPAQASRRGNKFREGLWPSIYDAATARRAAGVGALAAFVSAGITAVFPLLALFSGTQLADAAGLVDAAVAAFLGLMILRMSRVAAVVNLIWLIAERALAGFVDGPGAAIGVVVVFLVLYSIAGVRGTFAYHRYRQGSTVVLPRPQP